MRWQEATAESDTGKAWRVSADGRYKYIININGLYEKYHADCGAELVPAQSSEIVGYTDWKPLTTDN